MSRRRPGLNVSGSILIVLAIALLTRPVYAYKDGGHDSITSEAAARLITQHLAPDVQMYFVPLHNNTFGASAERAAHSVHSSFPLWAKDVAMYDGGPFDSWLDKVQRDYQSGQFEKAYTELGTLVHLMEDQHAPPHAANILHALNHVDLYESQALPPLKFLWSTIDSHSKVSEWSQLQDYYVAATRENKGRLPGYKDPSGAWLLS